MTMEHLRGNPIYFDGEWRYTDNGESTVATWKSRPCGYCHKPNRPDEHDACLGELPNVINACCGHGITSDAYIQFANKRIERGEDATARFNNANTKSEEE